MAVIFCGTTALWLYRSGVEFDAPLDKAAEREILNQTDVCQREARYARWAVDSMLKGRWDGGEIPNVLAKAPLSKPSLGVRQRQISKIHGGDIVPLRGNDEIYATSPAFSLNQVASEIGIERTALLMSELCGSFRLSCNTREDAKMNMDPRTSKSELDAFAARACRAYRKALDFSTDNCASPIEAQLYTMFVAGLNYGGYGLKPPKVNETIHLDAHARKIARLKSIKPDFLWEDEKLAIEYDSAQYHYKQEESSKADPYHDNKRAEALRVMGYDVRSITAQTLFEWSTFVEYMGNIRKTLDPASRKPTNNMLRARGDLYMLLFRSTDPLGYGYCY